MHSSDRHRSSQRHGFTLVEIVGVVALIAILAAILTPRVVGVISRGKVNSAAQSISSLRTATMDYLGAHSAFPIRDGTGSTNGPVTNGRFDADLVSAGLTDKLFSCSLGNQTYDNSPLTGRIHVRSQQAVASARVAAPTATRGGTNFDLDRDPATTDFTTAQRVVCAVIPAVALADAIALNRQIDGDLNSGKAADTVGRCLYSSANSDQQVTVYIYIAHQ